MAKVIIDGTEHEYDVDFDVGEAKIIKRYTGLNLEDLETASPSDPFFIGAILHIVFRRESPHLSYAELEQMAESVKLAKIDYREDEGVQLSPPEVSEPRTSDSVGGETGEHSNGSPAPSLVTEIPETIGHPV